MVYRSHLKILRRLTVSGGAHGVVLNTLNVFFIVTVLAADKEYVGVELFADIAGIPDAHIAGYHVKSVQESEVQKVCAVRCLLPAFYIHRRIDRYALYLFIA